MPLDHHTFSKAAAGPSAASSLSAPSTEECRICSEGDAGGALISPCDCRGGSAKVHARCLQRWIAQRPTEDDIEALKCEVCRRDYRITVRERFQCDRRFMCSGGSLRHAAEGGALLFLLGCTLLAFRLVSPGSHAGDATDASILFFMLLVTVGVSSYAVMGVFRRLRRSSSISELEQQEDPEPAYPPPMAAARRPQYSAGASLQPSTLSPLQRATSLRASLSHQHLHGMTALSLASITEEEGGSGSSSACAGDGSGHASRSASPYAVLAGPRQPSHSIVRRHAEQLQLQQLHQQQQQQPQHQLQ